MGSQETEVLTDLVEAWSSSRAVSFPVAYGVSGSRVSNRYGEAETGTAALRLRW